MAVNKRLLQLLEKAGVRYEVLPHKEVFTTKEVAETAHLPGRLVAKVVVMRDAANNDLMAVVPASQHVDRAILHRLTGRASLELENEVELSKLFPDCELGAMPPFGHLYGMPMYVDPCLSVREHIYFQAGNHHELVRMTYRDFARLAKPFFSESCLHKDVTVMSG